MQGNEEKNSTQNQTQGTGDENRGTTGSQGLEMKTGDQANKGQQSEQGQANKGQQQNAGDQNKQNAGAPGQNTGAAGQSSGTAGSQAGNGKSSGETGTSMVEKAKDAAGQVYENVAGGASTLISERKADLTSGLTGVAETVRRVSEAITGGEGEPEGVRGSASQYVETAAAKLEGVADYFDSTDLRGLTNDAQDYARRNPAVFLGGAFVLGVLAARFLKSRPIHTDQQGATRGALNSRSGSTRRGGSKTASAGASAN